MCKTLLGLSGMGGFVYYIDSPRLDHHIPVCSTMHHHRSQELSEELFFHISALLQEPSRGKRKVKQNINTLVSLGDTVQAIAGADHNRSGARMIAKQVTVLQKADSTLLQPENEGDMPSTATARTGGRHGGGGGGHGHHPHPHHHGGRVAPQRDPIPLPGSQGKRELGTVTVCKQHFGFIKCVERMGDLFYHESAVRAAEEGGVVDKVGPGDDVEFSVGQDPKTKQKIAYEYVDLGG